MLQKGKCKVDVAFLSLAKNDIHEDTLKHHFLTKKHLTIVVKSKKCHYICTQFTLTALIIKTIHIII